MNTVDYPPPDLYSSIFEEIRRLAPSGGAPLRSASALPWMGHPLRINGESAMRKNSRGPAFVTLLLLSPVAVWCGAYAESSAQTTTTTKVAVTAPGRVEGATDVMLVGTAASGTIAQLLVHEGARVGSGQPLVRIECAIIQKELDARNSSFAATEAVLARVLQGPRPEEIAIGVANVALAEARAEEAGLSLRRDSPSGGITITEAQLDQSKRDARIAAAQLDEARAKLALLRAGSRREDIVEAKSMRDAAKALVEEAQTRLDHCSVRAPADGVVLSIHVTPGQFISAAVPVTLLRLIDDSERRVRAEVDERDLAKICAKQSAVVTAESFPGVQIVAVTERISDGMTRRRSMLSGDRAEQGRDVREVILSLPGSKLNWPVGLRVSVKFGDCPADQGGATR
jgi:HlyD family secretion protein